MLYIKKVKFITRLGDNTNNNPNLMTLKLSIMVALTKDVEKLQVFRDSMLVIDWLR